MDFRSSGVVAVKPADYKCINCGHIDEMWIRNGHSFPELSECPKCQSPSKRLFSPLFKICHQGKCGNSNNGYKSNTEKVKKT